MNIFDQVAAKASYFYIHTTFNSNIQPNYLVNEFSRGIDGHFKSAARTTETYDPFYKFLIYPDPNGEKGPEGETCYRMAVPKYERHVVDFFARLTLQLPSDSKNQLFYFKQSSTSNLDPEKKFDWFNIMGVGKNDNIWIEPLSWVHPAEGRSDPEQIEHMKFRFEACDEKEPDKGRLKALDEKEPSRSNRPPDNEEIEFDEFGKKHVATEAIPAAYVTDNRAANKLVQVQNSPYYYLKRETVWVRGLLPSVHAPPGETTKYTDELITAFKSDHFESIQNTVGYTIDASLEGKISQETKVGIGEGGEEGEAKTTRSATLKLAVQYKNQTTSISRDQSSESTEIKHKVEKTYSPVEKGYRVDFWVPVDRYTLENTAGDKIGTWEHVDIAMAEEQRIMLKEAVTA